MHFIMFIPYYILHLLSCQPRVTVTTRFVYKVIMELESIDHLCINVDRINNSQAISPFALAQVECTSKCVNKIFRHCHFWLARQ